MSSPVNKLLTPLVAFGATLAGVLVLLFVQAEFAGVLFGGPGSACTAPDCVLGAGVWLIVGAFAALCVSMIAAVVVILRRVELSTAQAVRRGLFVALGCVLAYLIESIVLWIVV